MSSTLQVIASTTSKLRALLQETRKDLERLQTLQTSLTETLDGLFEKETSHDGNDSASSAPIVSLASDDRIWKETLSLLASGRVLGLSAQAEDALSAGGSSIRQRSWVSDGKAYARWLADGVIVVQCAGRQSAARQMLGKGLGLGYPNELVERLTQMMLFERALRTKYYGLVSGLPSWEQRQFLMALLPYVDSKVIARSANAEGAKANGTTKDDSETVTRRRISGAAALVQGLVQDNEPLQKELVEYLLARPSSTPLVRACIAALPLDCIRTLMERSWSQFGDKLCIKHKPIMQQESNARLLLLTVGRMHRSNPMDVFVMARSSHHGNAISERLASSSLRVRWLGMIVGTAISGLVDKDGKRMDFGVEEVETEEAEWYLNVVKIDDAAGEVKDLFDIKVSQKALKSATKAKARQSAPPGAASATNKPRIIEVVSSEDEDEGFAPYGKPASDASDSEPDATLIDRKKPKAPVYIRTLLSMLNDTENYDALHIALITAPSLITRKADFGSELRDQAEELASTMISLQDTYDMENFPMLRQNALVALVVAQPRLIGPWAAKMFFTADYSLAQRAVILTSIGLGGRELSGLGDENTAVAKMQNDADARNGSSFPTKRLPDRLHKVYGGEELSNTETKKLDASKTVDAISRQLEQTLLRPVSTKQSARPSRKVLRNDLASVVASAFFFPLTGGFASFAALMSNEASRTSLNDPTLLSLLVKTLTILLQASGRASPSLSQMTAELWSLVLALRTRAMHHRPLMEGILFAFLTILNITEPKAVAEGYGKLLMETREWVGGVWETMSNEGRGMRELMGGNDISDGRDSGQQEVERLKYLAAGVMVKLKEIVDEYRRVLIGDMVSF